MLSQTSKVVLGIVGDQLEKGDIKGIEEYGVSIDEANDIIYNWQLEAMAEMADALKYQQKEIAKLKAENIRLKAQPRFKMEEENLRLTMKLKEKEEEIVRLANKFDSLFHRHNDLLEGVRKIAYMRKGIENVEG